MFTRSKQYGNVEIKATFQWDQGDSSVGIAAGWGEGTGAEIIVPLAWTWREHVSSHPDPIRVPDKQRKLITFITFEVEDKVDPADWNITDLSVEYDSGNPVGALPLVSDPGAVLTLRVLPEVLEVVQEAWQDVKAAERLTAAQEAVYSLEAYADDLAHSHESGARMLLVQAQEDLGAARHELAQATEQAKGRGVT